MQTMLLGFQVRRADKWATVFLGDLYKSSADPSADPSADLPPEVRLA